MTNLKNRTSFVLHLDSLEIVEEMTGDQVKLFLQSIIQWHKNKTLPDLDFGMKMAIKPFLNQFIRDNEKWKDSSESGRIGNLKKWHPKIYQRFFSKEISLEEAEDLVKLKNLSPPIAPDKIISPPIKPDEIKSGNDRDQSLSVSVSVSDSVINTNDLLKSLTISPKNPKQKKQAEEKPERPDFILKENWEAYLEMRKKKKAVPTDFAIKQIFLSLESFEKKKQGNANESLKKSTVNNWTDVYEPKETQITKPKIHTNFENQNYAAGTEGFKVG